MARRRYNPRQPRDNHGRWKKTGSSGSSRSTAARQKKAAPTANEHAQRAVGNVIGAVFATTTGRPITAGIHAVGAATATYRVAAMGAGKYVQSSGKFSAAQKRTFKVRKAAVDRQVDRIEKAQSIALAGSYAVSLLATGAGLYNMQNAGKAGANLPRTLKSIGSGGAGLKLKKPSRAGVYNITSKR